LAVSGAAATYRPKKMAPKKLVLSSQGVRAREVTFAWFYDREMVIGPDVVFPFAQSQDFAEDASSVNADSHV
jgi:hypothetical protein